ncbi:hypothetical protein [Algiphilus sp.]|uniref:hypothetical protein n=2 Tax=Algiphilus sp. TaxID=1872431 RepID=UPI003BABD4C7
MSHSPTPPRQGVKPAMPEFIAPAMPPMELFAWMGRTGRAYWRRYRTERLLRAQPRLRDDIVSSAVASKPVNTRHAPPRV